MRNDGRLADDRAAERDALPLAARELLRLALQQLRQLEDLRRALRTRSSISRSARRWFRRPKARLSNTVMCG